MKVTKEQIEDAVTDTVGTRVVKYMADAMDLHETETDQEQNQIARHMAQFAERERARIRRLQAKALRVMRGVAPSYGDYIHTADIHEYMKAIDAITRPDSKRKRGAK